MSCRFGKAPAHLLDPAVDEPPGVVGPWAGLGVELERLGAHPAQLEAFDGPVVERDVRLLPRVARRDREAVVLRRDEDGVRRALEDRMVRAAVAERELERPASGCEGKELVAEADPENRDPSDQV